MAKKVAKKVKKKQKPKQKQKQKQSQRTSVTVNINTKSKTRKAPRATNGNTTRVLQQFAQPIITLPSNLINPPPMPQYGLNPSQLQTRRNDGEAVSMGRSLGSDSQLRERMRATAINDEQSLSGFSDSLRNYPTPQTSSGVPSDFTLYSDSLRNYQQPSISSSGAPSSDRLSNYSEPSRDYTASLGSSFTVGTDTPSVITRPTQTNFSSPVSSDYGGVLGGIYSQPGYATAGRPPAQPRREYTETPDTRVTRDRSFRDGGLSAEPPRDVGIPMSGNPSLKGSSSGMTFLPRRPTSDIDYPASAPMGDADTRSYSSY